MKACVQNKPKGGYSLVEMMVTLVVISIVVVGVYSLYNQMHKTQVSQEIKAEMHQNARNTLDTMTHEILMAGYRGEMMTAKIDEIEFSEYIQGDIEKYIRYKYDSTNKVIKRATKDTRAGTYDSTNEETIAENVSGIVFTYYTGPTEADRLAYDDATMITYEAAKNRNKTTIRRITVQLTVQSRRRDPATGNFRSMVLKADLVPKNLAEGEAAADYDPPDSPTNVRAIDNRDCGSITIKWDPPADSDVAGYNIFCTLLTPSGSCDADTAYLNLPIRVPLSSLNPEAPQYTISGLTITQIINKAASPNKYCISVQAYDTSSNTSPRSDPVSGNPDTDVTSFEMAGNDTTIDPAKPDPPTGMHAYNKDDTPPSPVGDNQILLTWTPSAEATVGYRLYRSDTPFSEWPISNSYMIADELNTKGIDLEPSTSSFLDTLEVSCKDYYYALCSVNCDSTQIYNGPEYAEEDYLLSGAAQARDDTGPPDPNIQSQSKGGWKRIFVNLINPYRIGAPEGLTDTPDFRETRIYYSLTDSIELNESTGVVSGGTLLPDSGKSGPPANPGDQGVFPDPGLSTKNSFVFNNMAADVGNYATPELPNDQTFYFLAVAYDNCGNWSSGSAVAKTLETLCGDDPVGYPATPINLSVDGCGDTITVNWSWAPLTDIDLQGYRVYRQLNNPIFSTDFATMNKNDGTPSGATCLTPAPVWGITHIDGTDPLYPVEDGGAYYYAIRATDCIWESIPLTGMPPIGEPAYDYIKEHNISLPSVIGPIYPGRLNRWDTTITHDPPEGDELYNFVTTPGIDPTDGSETWHHNAVKFYIQNTSAGDIEINQIKASWTNSAAYLKKVIIGGSPATISATETVFPVPVSSSDASAGKTLAVLLQEANAKATGVGVYSKAIPVILVFTNADGSVTETTDIRGDTIDVEWQYANESTGSTYCKAYMDTLHGNPIAVPFGPNMYSSTLNVPSWGSPAFVIPGRVAPPRTVLDDHPVASGGLDVYPYINVQNTEEFEFNDVETRTAGYKSAHIYYAVTDQSATSPDGATFNELTCDAECRIWAWDSGVEGWMAPWNGQRVWYYFVFESETGNKARFPEIQHGYCMYDQGEFNPCDYTPNAPQWQWQAYTLSAGQVQLNWDPPWQYTDGSTIDNMEPYQDPLTYEIYKKVGFGGTYAKVADVVPVNWWATNWTDPDVLTDNTFYKVRAANSCSTPNIGAFSSEVAICTGTGEGAAMILNPSSAIELWTNWSSPPNGWFGMSSVELKVYICARVDGKTYGNGDPESTIPLNVTSGAMGAVTLYLHEVADSGVFNYDGIDGGGWLTITADPSQYNTSSSDYILGATLSNLRSDTVAFDLPAGAGYDAQAASVDVSTSKCSSAPGTPTLVSATRVGATGANAKKVTLVWTKPGANADGSTPLDDLASYEIAYSYQQGSNTINGTVSITNPDQTSVVVDIGTTNQCTFKIKAIDSCQWGGLSSSYSNALTI